MSATDTERKDAIYDDLLDLELDTMTKIVAIIRAEWDAPTLKKEVEELNKQRIKLYEELELVDKK